MVLTRAQRIARRNQQPAPAPRQTPRTEPSRREKHQARKKAKRDKRTMTNEPKAKVYIVAHLPDGSPYGSYIRVEEETTEVFTGFNGALESLRGPLESPVHARATTMLDFPRFEEAFAALFEEARARSLARALATLDGPRCNGVVVHPDYRVYVNAKAPEWCLLRHGVVAVVDGPLGSHDLETIQRVFARYENEVNRLRAARDSDSDNFLVLARATRSRLQDALDTAPLSGVTCERILPRAH